MHIQGKLKGSFLFKSFPNWYNYGDSTHVRLSDASRYSILIATGYESKKWAWLCFLVLTSHAVAGVPDDCASAVLQGQASSSSHNGAVFLVLLLLLLPPPPSFSPWHIVTHTIRRRTTRITRRQRRSNTPSNHTRTTSIHTTHAKRTPPTTKVGTLTRRDIQMLGRDSML